MIYKTAVTKIYAILSMVLRHLGILRPIRGLIGPMIGRTLYSILGNRNSPSFIMGHTMYLAADNRYPPIGMITGKYEPATTDLIIRIAKPGMVAIDVGAHVGYYTLLLAQNVGPEGRVYSFEPEPVNYKLLSQNIELNGYGDKVKPINKAVSNITGYSELHIAGLDNGRNSFYHAGIPESGSVTVETTTVDGFLQSQEYPEIDLVKIDVEGAEYLVWEGMRTLISRSKNLIIIMEFNPSILKAAGFDPIYFLEQPKNMGFDVNWIDEETGSIFQISERGEELSRQLIAADKSVNLYCIQGQLS